MVKVAFLDRDGTLNEDPGYVYKASDFCLINSIKKLLLDLSSKGYELVIVTNQSGVARGYYTLEDSLQFSRLVVRELKMIGIEIVEVLTCPHHPDGVVKPYATLCECRKPRPKLIIDYLHKRGISGKGSIVVGNKLSDIEAGWNASLSGGILVGDDEPEDAIHKFKHMISKHTKVFNFERFYNK